MWSGWKVGMHTRMSWMTRRTGRRKSMNGKYLSTGAPPLHSSKIWFQLPPFRKLESRISEENNPSSASPISDCEDAVNDWLYYVPIHVLRVLSPTTGVPARWRGKHKRMKKGIQRFSKFCLRSFLIQWLLHPPPADSGIAHLSSICRLRVLPDIDGVSRILKVYRILIYVCDRETKLRTLIQKNNQMRQGIIHVCKRQRDGPSARPLTELFNTRRSGSGARAWYHAILEHLGRLSCQPLGWNVSSPAQ